MSNDDHPSHCTKQAKTQPPQLGGKFPVGSMASGDLPLCITTDLKYQLPILSDEILIVAHIVGDKLEVFLATLAKSSNQPETNL